MKKELYGLTNNDMTFATFRDISKEFNLKNFIEICRDNNILVIFEEGYNLKISNEIILYFKLKGLDIQLISETDFLSVITINNMPIHSYLKKFNMDEKDICLLYDNIGWYKAYDYFIMFLYTTLDDLQYVLKKYKIKFRYAKI